MRKRAAPGRPGLSGIPDAEAGFNRVDSDGKGRFGAERRSLEARSSRQQTGKKSSTDLVLTAAYQTKAKRLRRDPVSY